MLRCKSWTPLSKKVGKVMELTTPEVMEWIKEHATKIIGRDLQGIEAELIEYAVIQMKYEFWK
jgi:hypothetical protein